MHTIERLHALGQSAWLDFIDHELLASGELERRIEVDGLRGLTSNPTIFQKAIARGTDYDEIIRRAGRAPPERVLERIMVTEIRAACDRFRPTYEESERRDGFVSIEIPPTLANDGEASLAEARRVWEHVARPNLMVKIPGTREGLAAVRACLIDEINVNITLLFAIPRYLEVLEAYTSALETRLERGQPIDRVASVASFFVSRVDTKVDAALDAVPATDLERRRVATTLRGRIAIANAKMAYEAFERATAQPRFQNLTRSGARLQRLLWASTSTKDPKYPDLHYADALVGANTVDTMTDPTFHAYLDHGHPEPRLLRDRGRAREDLHRLATLGIDLARITAELEVEGVRAFADSYQAALSSIADKQRKLCAA